MDHKDFEEPKTNYFEDFDYSINAPHYSEPAPVENKKPDKPKKNWSFAPALIGALIGGLLVGIVLLGTLFALGVFNKSAPVTETATDIIDDVQQSVPESTIQAVAQVVPESVVGVSATGVQQQDTVFGPQNSEFSSVGSGFFVTSDGYVVTNQHVVVNDNSQLVISTEDGSEHQGQLVWSDSNLDIALVKTDVTNAKPLSIGNSDDIKVGEEVIAVGSPLGLAYSRTVTAGIVSAVNRSLVVNDQLIAEGLIQTDAAINSGNSGGPLVNTKGEVIGINTYKQVQGEGMGFAIPINLFKPIIEEVVQTGTFKPVTVGITGYDPEQARYMNTGNQIPKFDHGIYVVQVTQGSVAQKAGLQPGDIIKSIDDKQIDTMIQLRTILYSHKNGDKVKIVYERGGQDHTAEVTLNK